MIKAIFTDLLKHDIPAGLVVFLVALPLCLGIALASGAPLISGIVAGIVGGIVIGYLSGSHVSVSGPAAGLTVIVLDAIQRLGSFSHFLTAVSIAGAIQIALGALGLGLIANYVPIAVIEGMLTAIGIVIILKQIPHALGRHVDFEGDFAFSGNSNYTNTLNELLNSFLSITPGACVIFLSSLMVLLYWDKLSPKIHRSATYIPASLIAVIVGVALNQIFGIYLPNLHLPLGSSFLVQLPVINEGKSIFSILSQPELSALNSPDVWSVAVTLALVASLETLLSLEAADKLDPQRRISPPNRELIAQGCGNVVSGLLGGLPVTSVVVRTSANIYSGARSKWSTITHGTLLLVALMCIPGFLNLIPLSSLAAILLLIGFKLCKFHQFRYFYKLGIAQFIPFIVTVTAIIFSDLLSGVVLGLTVGLFFVLRSNHHAAFTMVHQDSLYLIRFNKDVSFLHKSELKERLLSIPTGSSVIIDGIKSMFIDHDIIDVLTDFKRNAKYRKIHVIFRNITFA